MFRANCGKIVSRSFNVYTFWLSFTVLIAASTKKHKGHASQGQSIQDTQYRDIHCGGDEYSYIVLPTSFFSNQIQIHQFKNDSVRKNMII